MAKKVIVDEDDNEVNNNGLIILFFIILTIFIGSLCFISGIIYTSYLEGKNEDVCSEEKVKEKDINNKDSDTYVVEDNKIIDILDNKINDININNEIKYVYTYLEDTKNYYVFIAYGTYEDVQDKRIIYSDLDKNNIYKELNIKDNFIIDDSNYDDFGKYKITFIKDGDNSYFKSLERLE